MKTKGIEHMDAAWAAFESYREKGRGSSSNTGPIKSIKDITSNLKSARLGDAKVQEQNAQALLDALSPSSNDSF